MRCWSCIHKTEIDGADRKSLNITKVKVNQRFSIILPLGLKSFEGGAADCFAKNGHEPLYLGSN